MCSCHFGSSKSRNCVVQLPRPFFRCPASSECLRVFGLIQWAVRVKRGSPPSLAWAHTKVQQGVSSEGPALPNRGIFRGLGRLPTACRGRAFWHGSRGKVLNVPRLRCPSCYAVIGRRGLPTLVECLRSMVLRMVWSEGLSFLGCALGPGCLRLYQNPRSHHYVEFRALGPPEFCYSAGVGLVAYSAHLGVTVCDRGRA